MKQSLVPSLETPEILIHVSGDLSLEGWQNREVSVHCGSSDGPVMREEDDLIRIECAGDCKVSVPTGSSIQIKHVGGDARLKKLSGPLSIGKIGGDLDLENVAQVSLESVGGDAGIIQAHGDIHAGKVGGDLNGSAVLGGLLIDRVGGDLSLNDCSSVQGSAGGDISVRVNQLGSQGSALRAGGDIRLVVPENQSARFVLESGGRDISIRLKDLSNHIETRSYQFSTGSGEQVEYSLEAQGDISISGMSVPPQETTVAEEIAGQEEEIARMGEEIANQVETSLKETDFTARIRSSLPQRTQEMTERAIRRADERIQAVLRRMDVRRGQKEVGDIPAPIVPPAPSQTPADWTPQSPEQSPPAGQTSEPVTDDERLRILQMVENKKITVDEAEALLEALENQSQE